MSAGESIAGLGGRGDFVAPAPGFDAARVRLSPEEGALLKAVGRASRIDEVLRRSGLPEAKAISVLLALRAKGAIAPARVTGSAVVDAAASEEVDLEPERKREILALEQLAQGDDLFALLGVAPGAEPEEVRRAYHEASRKFHPDRYFGKSLGSFKGRIERVFKRLAEANQTLTDPTKRAAYLAQHPELTQEAARPRTEVDEARSAERRARLAHHPYLAKAARMGEMVHRARAHIAAGDFTKAYTELNLAAQADPQNREVQQALQELRKKHEAQRVTDELKRGQEAEERGDVDGALSAYRLATTTDPTHASAAYRAALLLYRAKGELKEAKLLAQRAADLEPKNADAKVLLGQVLFDADLKKLAKKAFEDALRVDPDHAEAKKQLKKFRWPF
jgi:curved DNA-binding protein CbpA